MSDDDFSISEDNFSDESFGDAALEEKTPVRAPLFSFFCDIYATWSEDGERGHFLLPLSKCCSFRVCLGRSAMLEGS